MCGQYRLSQRKELRERFDTYGEYDDAPRYNIAPSQPVLAIRQEPIQSAAERVNHALGALLKIDSAAQCAR
jgi:putative SOS response-associated peptidase YedK